MSYTLIPYLVDLGAVRNAVGSRNAELIAAVIDYHPEPFLICMEEDLEEGELSLAQALTELIQGKLTNPESAHQYGYALKELCDYLGEELDHESWTGIRRDSLIGTGLDKMLGESGSPIDLPPNPGDFPVIGFQSRDWIRQEVAYLGGSRMQAKERDLQPLVDEYEDWLRTATLRNKDLVYFYQ